MKTAKYCLATQGKIATAKEKKIYQCPGCEKILSTSRCLAEHETICKQVSVPMECVHCKTFFVSEKQLEVHTDICVTRLKKEVGFLEDKVKELEDIITDLEVELKVSKASTETMGEAVERVAKASKPVINGNVNVVNLAPMDMEKVLCKLKDIELTKGHVMDGQVGVARALLPCLFDDDGKLMIQCTDRSRGVFCALDKDGIITKDYKARNLATSVEPIILPKAKKVYSDYNDEYFENDMPSLGALEDCLEEEKEILREKTRDLENYFVGTRPYEFTKVEIEACKVRIKDVEDDIFRCKQTQGLRDREELVKMMNGFREIENLSKVEDKNYRFSGSLAKILPQ